MEVLEASMEAYSMELVEVGSFHGRILHGRSGSFRINPPWKLPPPQRKLSRKTMEAAYTPGIGAALSLPHLSLGEFFVLTTVFPCTKQNIYQV